MGNKATAAHGAVTVPRCALSDAYSQGQPPYPFAARLGLILAPERGFAGGFAGGMDMTLPRWSLGTGFATRIDVEALISARTGISSSFFSFNTSTLVPVTVDQVYTRRARSGNRYYAGLGIGPYISDGTRLGGKLFLGGDFTATVGGEVSLHFLGTGKPLVALQLRLPLDPERRPPRKK